jgi:small subunit ribosomal protein S20
LGVFGGFDIVASHASALKAHRQSLKHRERNRQLRARLRAALRNIRTAINDEKAADVTSGVKQTFSLVDKMANKGIIHRNAANRYKSRLAARLTARA